VEGEDMSGKKTVNKKDVVEEMVDIVRNLSEKFAEALKEKRFKNDPASLIEELVEGLLLDQLNDGSAFMTMVSRR
jgi:hypothetical protein